MKGRRLMLVVALVTGMLPTWAGQLIPQKLEEVMNSADLALKVRVTEVKQARVPEKSPMGTERGPAVTITTELTADVIQVLGGKCEAKTIQIKHSVHFDPYEYVQVQGSGIESDMAKGEEYIVFLHKPFHGQKEYGLIRAESKENFAATEKAIAEHGIFGDVDKFVARLKTLAAEAADPVRDQHESSFTRGRPASAPT